MKLGRTIMIGLMTSALLFAAQGEGKGPHKGHKGKIGDGEISKVVETGNAAS